MRSVLASLAVHSVDRARSVAIIESDGSTHCWSSIAERAQQVRSFVEQRTEVGARVCVSLPSGSDFWCAVLGVASAGRMPCVLPHPLPGNIRTRLACELNPALMLDTSTVIDASHTRLSVHSHRDPCGVILLSSGTTGVSRFIVRSADAIDAVARNNVQEELVLREDRIASFLPMAHAYGFEHAFLAPVLVGACVQAMGSFSLQKASDALANGATVLPLVPVTASALAEARPQARRLRCAIVAGTVLSRAVRERFKHTFHTELVDLYGATELGTIWLDRGMGGKPVAGVEVTLEREGVACPCELLIRSTSMLDSIIDERGASIRATTDGYFRTGDLGRRAADGALFITGRTKLVFDVGGLKVNPIEVEHALETHPAVARALVKPLEMGGGMCRVSAEFEVRAGFSAPSVQTLREHLGALLPAHAIPRSIVLVEHLPQSASGKLLRVAHRAPIAPVVSRPKGLEARRDREDYTKKLFDNSAKGYDISSGATFLRSGRWYRRRMLLRAGLKAGSALLDVGSGTGLCAALAQEIVGSSGRVVALDPSSGMLEVARKRGVRETVEGRAESLPFPDATFDVVSMSYMLRHIEDLMLAFREARRVLRPGGKIAIFEITRPTSLGARSAFDLAMYWVAPSLGVLSSGRPSTFPMMRYWADTMAAAARPERIVEALDQSGFTGTKHLLEVAVFSSYRGSAPLS